MSYKRLPALVDIAEMLQDWLDEVGEPADEDYRMHVSFCRGINTSDGIIVYFAGTEVVVWDSEGDTELSLASCQREFRKFLSNLKPFMEKLCEPADSPGS